MIGQTVSHYRIIEKLGAGGMGEVYLAEDTKLDRKVALKFLPTSTAGDPEARERLLREARAASKLHHPNIVTIHSIEAHDGNDFIAMEYVEGVPITQYVARHETTADDFRKTLCQLCEGLHHAHASGVVHRDLKPDNILVESDGRVRIMDFGVAMLSGTPRLTRTGSMVGTTAYVSPEQVRGDDADERSDLFSLGVLMYELVTGTHPFSGAHEAATLYSIAHEAPAPMAELVPDIDPQLAAAIEKCLQKDPAKRFASAREVGQSLNPRPAPTVADLPETRYARSGNINIAYQVYGEGDIDLVIVMGFVSHVELIWQDPYARVILDRLGKSFRVIIFDKRGTGLSDRVAELPPLEQRMDDVRAVMDAAKSERAVLFGISEGGPMCMLFAATYPDRTRGLISYGSYALRIRDEKYPWAPSREEREQEIRDVEEFWGQTMDLGDLAPSLSKDPAYVKLLTTYVRQSASPGAAAALLRMNSKVDIRSILPGIRVPALVLHRRGDRDVAFGGGRYIAEQIPGATFVALQGDDHLPWAGDTEPILRAIEDFAGELGARGTPDSALLTALHVRTDQADSADFRAALDTTCASYPVRLVQFDPQGATVLFDGPIRSLKAAEHLAEKLGETSSAWSIGLHSGECTLSKSTARGVAVDVATEIARISAGPGVRLTSTVQELVAEVGMSFREFGSVSVPGIDYTWRVMELPLSVAGAPAQAQHSIAVLPFTNMSADPENEYFSDGLAEDLINALTNLKQLRVVSRTSSFAFRGKETDIREIGRKLSVDTVLEGSVRKAGKRLRITAQLINVKDGYHLWSERFDREMEDIFAIQDEISQAIVAALKITLVGAREVSKVRRPTENIEAYNLALRGRYFWSKRTERGLMKAIECYEQAIALDAGYAPAHVGLADCCCLLAAYHIKSPAESMPQARAAAATAMKLDPGLAEAWEAQAHVRLLDDWNWAESEREYRKAIELNPGYATAHQRLALLLSLSGRFDEAREQVARARELEPLSLIISADVALVSYLARDFERAHEQCLATLDTDPNFGVAHFIHGLTLEQLGRFEDAIAAFDRAKSNTGGIAVTLGALGHARAKAGDADEARFLLEEAREMSERRFVSPYSLATIHLGLGETDAALDCLERAVRERSVWGVHLHMKVDPRLDPLRTHPRFTVLMKMAGF